MQIVINLNPTLWTITIWSIIIASILWSFFGMIIYHRTIKMLPETGASAVNSSRMLQFIFICGPIVVLYIVGKMTISVIKEIIEKVALWGSNFTRMD